MERFTVHIITDEPLKLIAKDDPVSVATYAYENDLLETPGWTYLT